jgi:hypothetical protein
MPAAESKEPETIDRPPLPLGEGWGEGAGKNTLILTFSHREKELKPMSLPDC